MRYGDPPPPPSRPQKDVWFINLPFFGGCGHAMTRLSKKEVLKKFPEMPTACFLPAKLWFSLTQNRRHVFDALEKPQRPHGRHLSSCFVLPVFHFSLFICTPAILTASITTKGRFAHLLFSSDDIIGNMDEYLQTLHI